MTASRRLADAPGSRVAQPNLLRVLGRLLARLFESLPAAPLTVAQVDLLLDDNLPASGMPGLRELGILPHRLEDALADLPAAP
jgi:hypothetical protein